MRMLVQIAACLVALTSSAFAADLRHPSSLNSFCVDPARDDLCPDFPNDQTDFSDKFVYMFINVETQTPFDVFSWQAFVSLFWPETGRLPLETSSSWPNLHRREKVFGNDLAGQACGSNAAGADVMTSNIAQSDGNVLIDQNGNFIVYETRLNSAAEGYIMDELLHTRTGQIARGDQAISFPQGSIGTDPKPASVLIKTAWQILTPDTDRTQYIVKEGLIFVPAKHAANGKDMCIREPLGLIGMHVVSRIQSGNGDEWLWSTFEHKQTVPTAGNTRRVNAIFCGGVHLFRRRV